MPSILAIVSKAVFEKTAPKAVKPGDVLATDRYVSNQSVFAQLGTSDALFLVTVRPPAEALWLVAVLENVRRKGDAWVGEANVTPIRDITPAIKQLTFSTGAGIKAKKGALGMSLQTPRVLTAEDVALLRGRTRAVAAYDAEVAQTPAAAKATAAGKRAAKSKDGERLRLVNYRRPFEILDELPAAQLKQLTQLTRQNKAGKPSALVHHEDWAPMELVDVLDVPTSEVTHQLYVWPWGSGELFVHDTTTRAAAIIQHSFLAEAEDAAFRSAMAAAYSSARPKLAEVVDFGLDRKPEPTEDEESAKLAKAYARLVETLGKSKERYRDYEALTKEQQKVIRHVFKTEHIDALADAHDLGALGMPPVIRLRSWCGHSPHTEFEARAGRWPVWKWLLEARAGKVKDDEAIDAITTSLPRPAFMEVAWKACEPFFDYGFWGEVLAYEGGNRLTGPEQQHMVQLLAKLVDVCAYDSAIGFADRVKREKVEPHVWSQALAAIAATALARYAQRTGERVPKKLAGLETAAGALFARP